MQKRKIRLPRKEEKSKWKIKRLNLSNALKNATGNVIRFAVGDTGFDSLVKSDQKISKTGIHNFSI